MRRIWVIGASGSGKSTLAMALAARLGVPWVELDGLHHGPGWAEPDPAEFRATVAHELARDGWVVDGSYREKLGDMVPEAADTIVWLDLPLRVTVRRMLWRSARRWWQQTELWNGNRESLRGVLGGRESLLYWSIKKHRQYRRKLPADLAGPQYAGKQIVRLRSEREVRSWLAGVRPD
jgi:adenylate kinase family enzyme